jgi:hypothetical protein
MNEATVERLVLVFYVWSYKLVALLVGYLFARLGYTLFLKGVTGEFKFSTDIRGVKADLASVSPGLFLILMGAIVLCITIYKGFDVDFPAASTTDSRPGSLRGSDEPARPERPKTLLPDQPPSFAPAAPPPREESHGAK